MVRETSRTATVWRTNTYCVPWFFQLLGGKKRGIDRSLDYRSFGPFEFLWFLFPLLVLRKATCLVTGTAHSTSQTGC